MNQAYIITALCIIAGLFFLIRNLLFLINEERLKDYLKTSAKGIAWVQKYGMEKSIQHSKQTLIPIGCVIGLALFSFGLWNLSKLL
ncbi:hypothetical protein K6Y31_01495 [Motilimonas cestriensis]|uniref:Uncharacterized protein n=1 Tax=Motilimonas cestriensis TaxID=2742685 RepID=A0ABS8W5C3_9GAMM|nr:hypothetical protein [Motilimonas cestriensis]MCE2593490.1 hypothetical protein [Motilimonas cestriensis]